MARLLAVVCVACMTLPFSLSLQLTNVGAPTVGPEESKNSDWGKPKNFAHEKSKKSKNSDDGPTNEEDEEMWAADNLTAWGSKYKSNGLYPRLALGLSCPKCGSSFFYQVLARHPDILGPAKKETQYFSGNGKDGKALSVCPKLKHKDSKKTKVNYLNSCFKETAAGKKQDPWSTNKTLFEFTPGYLTQAADDAEIMLQFKNLDKQSDTRFLVVLRDPVERFVSELNMRRLNHDIMQTMSDKEMEKYSLKKMDEEAYSIRLGHYSHNLKMWLKTFPRERLLVVNKVALDNPVAWRRVLKFLGLSHTHEGEEIAPRLIAHAKKFEEQVNNPKDSYLQLSDKTTTKLKEHYQPHNQMLWRLLGVDPWWAAW